MSGLKIAKSSTWNLETMETYLRDSRLPCRLSCSTPSGHPHVMSLWFLYIKDKMYCSVQSKTKIIEWLLENPKCGFEVSTNEPPYKGVRGRGEATILSSEEENILPVLVDRYLGDCMSPLASKLLARSETEMTIKINFNWLTSWDYTSRMAS